MKWILQVKDQRMCRSCPKDAFTKLLTVNNKNCSHTCEQFLFGNYLIGIFFLYWSLKKIPNPPSLDSRQRLHGEQVAEGRDEGVHERPRDMDRKEGDGDGEVDQEGDGGDAEDARLPGLVGLDPLVSVLQELDLFFYFHMPSIYQ